MWATRSSARRRQVERGIGYQRAEAARHVGDERTRQQQPSGERHRRARVGAAGAREQVGGEAEEGEEEGERQRVAAVGERFDHRHAVVRVLDAVGRRHEEQLCKVNLEPAHRERPLQPAAHKGERVLGAPYELRLGERGALERVVRRAFGCHQHKSQRDVRGGARCEQHQPHRHARRAADRAQAQTKLLGGEDRRQHDAELLAQHRRGEARAQRDDAAQPRQRCQRAAAAAAAEPGGDRVWRRRGTRSRRGARRGPPCR